MNILHLKYAYEVARAGSLAKASEKLLIAVPNISRSIKELETDLGITIFERTTKGMELTPEGEEFLNFARAILDRIDSVEKLEEAILRTKEAQKIFITFSQQQVDKIFLAAASADAARTYLLFCLSGDNETAKKYLDLFCKTSNTAKQYVQKWMPIVAASQSVKGNQHERDFLLSWVDVVDYQ